jgi:hypothetical protein
VIKKILQAAIWLRDKVFLNIWRFVKWISDKIGFTDFLLSVYEKFANLLLILRIGWQFLTFVFESPGRALDILYNKFIKFVSDLYKIWSEFWDWISDKMNILPDFSFGDIHDLKESNEKMTKVVDARQREHTRKTIQSIKTVNRQRTQNIYLAPQTGIIGAGNIDITNDPLKKSYINPLFLGL